MANAARVERAFAVPLPQGALGEVVRSERTEADRDALRGEDEARLDAAMERRARSLELATEAVLLGELYSLYLARRRGCGPSSTMVPDGGEHVCVPGRCTLSEVFGDAFHFAPGHAHVCLVGCTAPRAYHVGRKVPLSGTLYVCDTSGKAHFCSPEACDADHAQELEGTVCRLTGKLLHDAPMWRGWHDDRLRTLLVAPSKRRRSSGSQRGATPAFETRTAMTQLADVPEDRVGRERYRELYGWCVARAEQTLRPLLWGHEARETREARRAVKLLARIVQRRDGALRTAVQRGEPVDLHALGLSEARDVHQLSSQPIPPWSPAVGSALARVHARMAVRQGVALLRHTDLARYELDLDAYVLASVYLRRETIRVQGRVLVSVDASLATHLPNAGELASYSHLKSVRFTSAKTAIRASMIAAVERGVAISHLVWPEVRVSDLVFG